MKKTLLLSLLAATVAFSGQGQLLAKNARMERCIPKKVSVSRDDQGVWFIKSFSTKAAFEEMGYCVATDRLWQLELYRRSGRGTLAEVFGSTQLSTDVFVRTIGYSEEELQAGFDDLKPRARKIVEAYVKGINRRIAEVREDPSQLPFEFHAIGNQLGFTYIPADWVPTDILAWGILLMRKFDCEALSTGQLDNAALIKELGAKFPYEHLQMFSDLRKMNDPDAQTMIPKEKGKLPPFPPFWQKCDLPDNIGKAAKKIRNRRKNLIKRLKKINAFVKMGSYAWALSGWKTDTGRPMLYSGPQMGFPTPSIVCEGSIKTPWYQVSGMTIPGLPGIVIGRTLNHAWSMQVGHAHTVDYYVDPPSAASLHRMETINVAGGSPVTIPVFRTEHGPVINPMPFNPAEPVDTVISWKYSHWGMEMKFVEALLGLGTAHNMRQFGKAVKKLPVSQHFTYVDRRGNIAYWMSGKDPIRAEGADPRFPQKGDGTQEWTGQYVKTPFAKNPRQGYFGGWNNKARADYNHNNRWDYYTFGPFHRAHVVEEYLSSTGRLSFDEVKNLALNIAMTDSFGMGGNPWAFASEAFTAAVEANPTDERLEALNLLQNWDGHFVNGTPEDWVSGTTRADAWVLQQQWILEVLRLTFEDELLTATLTWKDQHPHVLFNVLLHALYPDKYEASNLYDWFQDASNSGKPTTSEELILLALDNVLATLGDRPWNAPRGEIPYKHDILGPLGGTPFASRSTYAQCVEMGWFGPKRIESMFPLGQSGTVLMDFSTGAPVFDANFFSMKPYYDTWTYRKFPGFFKRRFRFDY